ncbi:hypothetical protein ACLGGT_21345 [Roseovarius sp. MS2]|uniref:hypothetical protein n=1 Tax=Roseovarius sp. MS2 TaxID=3390728 RepID=UPI003EDC0C56
MNWATDGLEFDVARQFELTEGLFGRLRAGNRALVQEFINDLATLSEAGVRHLGGTAGGAYGCH